MTSGSSGGRAAARGPARANTPGLQLDPNDPIDRRIISRQVNTARAAGRDGLDRAASTRGRADLEAAYDEGATAPAAPAGGGQGSPAAGGKGRGKPRGGKAASPSSKSGPGWKAFKPTSPARLPTRAADAGGFLSGLALYTVVVIYIRYGAEGWKGWLSAKFLNKPMAAGNTTSTGKPKTKKGGTAAV